jgi:hypothetical protein
VGQALSFSLSGYEKTPGRKPGVFLRCWRRHSLSYLRLFAALLLHRIPPCKKFRVPNRLDENFKCSGAVKSFFTFVTIMLKLYFKLR